MASLTYVGSVSHGFVVVSGVQRNAGSAVVGSSGATVIAPWSGSASALWAVPGWGEVSLAAIVGRSAQHSVNQANTTAPPRHVTERAVEPPVGRS